MHTSLDPLITYSYFSLPKSFSPLVTTSLFFNQYMCESFSVLTYTFNCFTFFFFFLSPHRDNIQYLSSFLWLTSLSMIHSTSFHMTANRVISACVHAQSFSCVRRFVTPWTVACQGLLSMGFPRQEYCSGLPFPSPRHLSNPGMKPVSPALAARFFTTEPPRKPQVTSIPL